MPTEKVFTGGFDLKHNQDDLSGGGSFVQTIGGQRFYDFSTGDFSVDFPEFPPLPDFPDFPDFSGDGLEEGMVVYDPVDNVFYYWDGTDWVLIDPTGSGATDPTVFVFEDILRYHHVDGMGRLEWDGAVATWTAFELPVDGLDLTTWELADINEVLPDWFQFDEVSEVFDPPGPASGPERYVYIDGPTGVDTEGFLYIIPTGLPLSDPGNGGIWLSDA